MHFANIQTTAGSLLKLYLNAATNYYVLGGLLCYGISVLTWMFVLSKTEVSYAYPFLSVGYLLSAIAGYYFFQEHISFSRKQGIAVICVGVNIIAMS
ncbi:MAG: 4-amino-4-deoxy-L-arabinose transferase [Gammaproteobacteria bacterium]|nr:4-amino-4-deoxy-L-arabinose transferase [Gammaproteobacteria bacterium]